MIFCESALEQLKKLILDAIKRHPLVAALGLDVDVLFDILFNLLKPYVLSSGILGTAPLIDKYVDREVGKLADNNLENKTPLLASHPLCNDGNFVLENWVDRHETPLLSNRINNLKRLHSEILVPMVKYYKEKSEDKFLKEACILKIITGLSADTRLTNTPVGEVSQHYVGKAVNFRINGIDDEVIIDDLKNKRLPVRVGAFGDPNGVFVTLPYTVDGTQIENMYVYRDNWGNLAYKFY